MHHRPCWIPRGWAGYVIDVITMGGYTTYRAHEYTKCITTSESDFYRIYRPEVDRLLNKTEVDDSLASKDRYRDTNK